MDILMVGSVCNVGCNLKDGLEDLGHSVRYVSDESVFDDYSPDIIMRWRDIFQKQYGDDFDIVHIHSPNLKKILLAHSYFKKAKLFCHWHGSDLRSLTKTFPVKKLLLQMADAHIYSTCDLAWWIKKGLKRHIWCPVDTDAFVPIGKGKGNITFDGGANSYNKHQIAHSDMPKYLSNFASADIHNAFGLDDKLMSVIALECLSCGLKVNQFPLLDREWVVNNASIPIVAKQIEDFYCEVLNANKEN